MSKFLILIALCILYLVYPTVNYAEKINAHFNRLPLMREKALKDHNDRAVKNIDYIGETTNGEYFEVDNDNPPIESVIYKLDRTKQRKPLQEKKDEDLIIYYFHMVDRYAGEYYAIVDAIITQEVEADKTWLQLENLDANYPGFSATYRALGATSLVLGDTHNAVHFAEKAVSINRNDPKALMLLSISDFAILKNDTALKYFMEATAVEPQRTMEFWEIEYVMEKEPTIYSAWSNYVGKNIIIEQQPEIELPKLK